MSKITLYIEYKLKITLLKGNIITLKEDSVRKT